jgi:hypothetical protein
MDELIFYSTKSKLTVTDDKLIIKDIASDRSDTNWVHSLVLFLIIYCAFVYDFAVNRNGTSVIWLFCLPVLYWAYLERPFLFLFFDKWGNKLLISEITKIEKLEPNNELEVCVKIWFGSRRKVFVFRILEKQLDGFNDALKSRHPRLSSARFGFSD